MNLTQVNGLFVALDEDECLGSPCEEGTCNNQPGNYSCVCPAERRGHNCERKKYSSLESWWSPPKPFLGMSRNAP